MLIDVYPRHVIEFLATHGTGAVPEAVAQLAHSHTGISIFFMDLVGFTPMSKDADPQDVMKMLNELFTALDTLCGAHDVYKVNNGRQLAVISGAHRYTCLLHIPLVSRKSSIAYSSAYLPLNIPHASANQVETVGDCYVAATGLMQDDGQGFMKITADHDPQQSAARMLEFAKGALAHSKTVMLPRSSTPVTVCMGRYDDWREQWGGRLTNQ